MTQIAYVLSQFLGEPKSISHNGKMSFDCPNCNDGKGNLDIDLSTQFFSCWACWNADEGGVWGKSLQGLFKRYAGYDWKRSWENYKEILETLNISPNLQKPINLVFPEGYIEFNETSYEKYQEALDYLLNRGLSLDIIKFYKIGFSNYGRYKNRIICPSLVKEGFNYFVGRAIDNNPVRYLAESVDKKSLFFNEMLIDYYSPIVLVEGVFDHYSCFNSIPLLGKSISDWQVDRLMNNAKNNIYIAMDKNARADAISIAKKLNFNSLNGKIYVVNMQEKDFSQMLPHIGHRGVLEYIKNNNTLFTHNTF